MEEPFKQWHLYVIGEIFLHSSKQHHYILIATNYFIWWIEEIILKGVNDEEVINFLKQNIISRFGIPTSLVFDNATYFSSLRLYDFSLENGIVLKHSTNYYPRGKVLLSPPIRTSSTSLKTLFSLNKGAGTLLW